MLFDAIVTLDVRRTRCDGANQAHRVGYSGEKPLGTHANRQRQRQRSQKILIVLPSPVSLIGGFICPVADTSTITRGL